MMKNESTVEATITAEELREICDATVRLTELKQRGCNHLCIENVAPKIMRRLLLTLKLHKEGFVNSTDMGDTGIVAYFESEFGR